MVLRIAAGLAAGTAVFPAAVFTIHFLIAPPDPDPCEKYGLMDCKPALTFAAFLGLLVGLTVFAAGPFIAIRIARRAPVLIGAVTGVLSIILTAVLAGIFVSDVYPYAVDDPADYFVTALCACLGAAIGQIEARRASA